MALEPIVVLREAIKQVPAVKYALGVAGVAATAAITVNFVGYSKAGLILISITFIAMILLYVFANMVSNTNKSTTMPGLILLYSVIGFFILFLIFTVTAFAVGWPPSWADVLGINPPSSRMNTLSAGPITVRPGETRNVAVDLKRKGIVDIKIDQIAPEWTGYEKMRDEWIKAGRGNTPEIYIKICSAKQGDACVSGFQRGVNRPVRVDLDPGPASIEFINFGTNPPISFSTTILYSE